MAEKRLHYRCSVCNRQLIGISPVDMQWHEANCLRTQELNRREIAINAQLGKLSPTDQIVASHAINQIALAIEEGGIVVMHVHKGRSIVYYRGKELFGKTLHDALKGIV